MQNRHRDILLISLLVVVNLAYRYWLVSASGFDGLYGQDAFAYFNFAEDLSSGITPRPFFFPLGYPLLLAIPFRLFGASANLALSITIGMATFIPVLGYILGRQLRLSLWAAFTVGLLLSWSPQLVQSGVVIMADIPALFWCMVSMVSVVEYANSHHRKWLLLTAIALGLAIITRWIYVVQIIPISICIGYAWGWRPRWREIGIFIVAILLVAIPQILYSQLNPVPFLDHVHVVGWSPVNALQKTFVTGDGTLNYETVNGLFYLRPYYDSLYSHWLVAFGFLGGIMLLTMRRHWRNLAILLTWAGLPYLFFIGMTFQNVRFPILILPAVALFVGIALDNIQKYLTQAVPKWVVWGAINLLILIPITSMILTATEHTQGFIQRHQNEKAIVHWANQQLQPDSMLITFGLTLIAEHYTDQEIVQLFYESPETLALRLTPDSPAYLLLNVWFVENQWVGLAPQTNYHWLAEEYGLTILGRNGNYTLFQVGS